MKKNGKLTVGILAEKTGCNAETVRYYEKTGMMPEPSRSAGGHRLYTSDHIKRLLFIRRCRELGFNIERVKDMLRFIDEPNHACCEVRAKTVAHIEDIQRKIADLSRLAAALQSMQAHCQDGSQSAKDCPIIEALYDTEGGAWPGH